MYNKVDARGKACPIPVVMTKKEVDNGSENFIVLVDNKTAVENLKRFGKNSGYQTEITESNSEFEVSFTKMVDFDNCIIIDNDKKWAVFVGNEGIGEGDLDLGSSLMKMFFYTLNQDKDIPRYILFMNKGVKVATDNDQVVEQLKALQKMGSEILVCGTCLNYYNIADKLKIGTVSNMYDIVSTMKAADKVITL